MSVILPISGHSPQGNSRPTLAQRLDNFSRQTRNNLTPSCLIVPLACISVILMAPGITGGIFDGSVSLFTKGTQEWIGPSTTCLAMCVAAGCFAWRRSAGMLWLAIFAGNFFLRELHFRVTNEGVYVVFAALMTAAILRSEWFTDLLNNRRTQTCLVSALGTYVIAVSLDQGLWKFLANWRAWATNMEESMESLGHMQVLLAVISQATATTVMNTATVDQRVGEQRQAA